MNTITLSGLAKRLVSEGEISEADAQTAQMESTKKRIPLVSYLVENELARNVSMG